MRLLATLVCTTLASASVVRFCTGFEGRTNAFAPLFEVATKYENTSVLMAHINDFKRELVKKFEFDVEEIMPYVVYPVCMEDDVGVNNGTCTSEKVGLFGLEDIMGPNITLPIISTVIGPGENATYEVSTAGVYCALTFQPSTETTEGVEFHVKHLYGDSKLTSHQALKISLAFFVCAISYFLMLFLLKGIPHHSRNTAWNMTKHVVMGKLTFCGVQVIHSFQLIETESYFPAFNTWFILDHILSLLVIFVFYAILNGVFTNFAGGFDRYIGDGYSERRCDFAGLLYVVCLFCGMIWVSMRDSPARNILVSDILGAVVALLFSSNYLYHCRECIYRGRQQHGGKFLFRFLDRRSEILKDGAHPRCSVKIEQVLKGYIFFVVFGYMTIELLMRTGTAYMYFRETRPLGFAHEPRLCFQHIIGLNISCNWLWFQLKLLFEKLLIKFYC